MRLTFLLGLLVLALTAEAAKLKVTFLPTCFTASSVDDGGLATASRLPGTGLDPS